MQYLTDTWYAAGWSHEVTRTPMLRMLLKGQLFGDTIRCPYHGLRFNPQGICVDNPVGGGADRFR